ncbi:MAG: trehalose-6-phosphate synthase, partial [Gemmatimonadota bacterium]
MFRPVRFSLRFIVPLFVAMLGLAYVAVPLMDTLMLRWFVRDLDIRSSLIGRTLGDSIVEHMESGNWARIDALLERATSDERLYAVAICSPEGRMLRHTRALPASIDCSAVKKLDADGSEVLNLPQGPVHLSVSELHSDGRNLGALLLVHDMSFIARRSEDTRKYVLLTFAVLGVAAGLISVAVALLSWRGWMSGVRAMLRGEGVFRPFSHPRPELQPLVGDLRTLLREMQTERRLQDDATMQWTPDTLRRLLRQELSGDEVIVVSNREPYIHVRSAAGIEVQRPASGLVTAVEPVMRACSGTWIAHGGGSADRETADKHGRLRVPPGESAYTLRRIWLTKAEEQGYYYGFANEGLWPLCHIAHVRPVFRTEDWAQY